MTLVLGDDNMYDYIVSKPNLDEYLEHHGILGMKWGKKNGPPYPLDDSVSTGSKLKKSQSSSDSGQDDISKAVKNTKIKVNKDWNIYDADFKVGKDKINVHGDIDAGEDAIRETAESLLRNKEDFKKAVLEGCKSDGTVGENGWCTEKDFKDRLDLKSAYVSDNGWVEAHFYEKDDFDDVLGGHEIDVFIDIKNPKRKIHRSDISVNG